MGFSTGGRKMKQPTLHVCAAAFALSYAAMSFASQNSTTVFPAEGNKQCSDYSSNSVIMQMGTTSPVAAGTLSGGDNPKDADTTGESAAYTVANGKVVGFTASSTPIDYALLKSKTNISVIIYPSGGVSSDADMRLTVAGVDLPITAISLCYGLGNQVTPPPPPPPLAKLKSCNIDAFLDATGVSCPTSGERTLVCNFELDKSFYGLKDGTDSCCVCNNEGDKPLSECNPDLPVGTVVAEGEAPACIKPADKTVDTEVTTHIELNNDPYVCSTVAGKRTCYYY
jgi:hypothetical protein